MVQTRNFLLLTDKCPYWNSCTPRFLSPVLFCSFLDSCSHTLLLGKPCRAWPSSTCTCSRSCWCNRLHNRRDILGIERYLLQSAVSGSLKKLTKFRLLHVLCTLNVFFSVITVHKNSVSIWQNPTITYIESLHEQIILLRTKKITLTWYYIRNMRVVWDQGLTKSIHASQRKFLVWYFTIISLSFLRIMFGGKTNSLIIPEIKS